ncbi:unnamed protein product [Medioppia subpectinata]|uniref:FAS1 domain-containing protein n=1 Tax=Medioppia subpectinata TaxID=1979941 RepID=A0A7R9KDU3_9ACAR|nr:unnamed protein product [Medioppia subpectinata]CAG2100719.1 unnamed protein product [Medioppia subpectinata]
MRRFYDRLFLPFLTRKYLSLNIFLVVLSNMIAAKLSLLIDCPSGRKHNSQQVYDHSYNIAAAFVSLGLQKGDVVLFISPNSDYYAIALLGVMAAGGVFSACREIFNAVEDTTAKYLVCTKENLEDIKKIADSLPQIRCDIDLPKRVNCETDMAALLLSSGSTGRPKPIIRSHKNVINLTHQYQHPEIWGLTDKSVHSCQNTFCHSTLLRNHITPHTICPHALIADHTIKTIDNNDMIFSCNGNDRYINGVHMNGQMLGAANGVINVVDEVLIPDSVKSLYELVDKRQQLSSFKRTLDQCPEEVLVLEESNRSYSLFAPNNYAFEKLKSYQLGNILDNCRLFVESHLIPYRLTTKSITNNKTIYTLAKNRFINCTITAKGISVNSALIKEYDIEGANGVLHIIDEVLIIP